MLSCGTKFYHEAQILSCGNLCYHMTQTLIMRNQLLSWSQLFAENEQEGAINLNTVQFNQSFPLSPNHTPTRVQQIWFLKKIKNTDPLMGAKFKSKTHLFLKNFDFWHHFLRVWLQSLKKVQISPKKKLGGKNKKGFKKRRISCWFKSVEKFFFLNA